MRIAPATQPIIFAIVSGTLLYFSHLRGTICEAESNTERSASSSSEGCGLDSDGDSDSDSKTECAALHQQASLDRRQSASSSYWVDVSWPIQSRNISTNYGSLPDRQKIYDDFMGGCREFYGDEDGHLCDHVENDRVAMNRRQPMEMQNYTKVGFKKIRAPTKAFELLKEFWELNKDKGKAEVFPRGYTYVNNWEKDAMMVNVEDATLQGSGAELKQKLWDEASVIISEWTGLKLTTTSLYGVRVYKDGAILAPHVDRLPLISSAIINVAQDVDEPWPLEVYGHDGRAVNVTMEPGDIVLYESHSVIHGRPFALKGRFYANIFIHFEPAVPPANRAAGIGDIETLKRIAEEDSQGLYLKDKNGWQAIHEAARFGDVETIAWLLKNGADVNSRTNFGQTPLNLARIAHGDDDSSVKLLRGFGGSGVDG